MEYSAENMGPRDMTGMWLVLKTIRKSKREKLPEALTLRQVYERGNKKFVQTLFKNALYLTVNIHSTHYKDQSVSVIEGHKQLFIVRTVEYMCDFRLPPRCKLYLRSYGILRRNYVKFQNSADHLYNTHRPKYKMVQI